MANSYFQFKQFTVYHDRCAMKVTTDSCLFGAWVAYQLQEQRIDRLLDIGTGTGLLSLMVAQKNPVHIDAIEIDKEASTQARDNISASPWQHRIQIMQADARDFNPAVKYECIISNPPFYENELGSSQQTKNLAHHSEALTMMETVRVIKQNLQPKGSFFLLLPYKRWSEIKKLLEDQQVCLHHIVLVQQTLQHPPFRVMIRAAFEPGSLSTSTISIMDQPPAYTSAFIQLLEDYYLYL